MLYNVLYTVFKGDESAIAQQKFIDYFAVICEFWSESATSTMAEVIIYTGDFPHYASICDMLRIITRETKSKFLLTIGAFLIAFVTSVIEKFTQFLNTLTM